jgi:hypothetical protein
MRKAGERVAEIPALLDMKPIPVIAEHALRGEIALRNGDADGAVRHFRAAADVEDTMGYIETPSGTTRFAIPSAAPFSRPAGPPRRSVRIGRIF